MSHTFTHVHENKKNHVSDSHQEFFASFDNSGQRDVVKEEEIKCLGYVNFLVYTQGES